MCSLIYVSVSGTTSLCIDCRREEAPAKPKRNPAPSRAADNKGGKSAPKKKDAGFEISTVHRTHLWTDKNIFVVVRRGAMTIP